MSKKFALILLVLSIFQCNTFQSKKTSLSEKILYFQSSSDIAEIPEFWSKLEYKAFAGRKYFAQNEILEVYRIDFEDHDLARGAYFNIREHQWKNSRKKYLKGFSTYGNKNAGFIYINKTLQIAAINQGKSTFYLKTAPGYDIKKWYKLIDDFTSLFEQGPPKPNYFALTLREEVDQRRLFYANTKPVPNSILLRNFYYSSYRRKGLKDTIFAFKEFKRIRAAENFMYALTQKGAVFTEWRYKELTYKVAIQQNHRSFEYYFNYNQMVFVFITSLSEKQVKKEIDQIFQSWIL